MYEVSGGIEEIRAIGARHPAKILVLDFYARWCGPCKSIAPAVHDIIEQHPNLVLCKIDVDRKGNDSAVNAFEVTAMPTFVWVRAENSGAIVGRVTGANLPQFRDVCNLASQQ